MTAGIGKGMSKLREEILIALDTSFEDYDYPSPKGKVSAFDLAADGILSALQTAVLAAAPEKPSNELIQQSLQNGKPQQAASYNGYAAAINDCTKALQQLFESEG